MTGAGGTATEPIGAKIVRYGDTGAAPPEALFLDANAVLDIFAHEQAMRKASDPAFAARRNPDLLGFLTRMKSKSTKLFVTPAVLEEVFHVLWIKVLSGSKQKWACSTCALKTAQDRDVRRHHPTEFAATRAAAVRLFSQAASDAKKHGVRIWLPGDDPTTIGQKVFDAFLALLTRYDSVGGKDALHVVTAALLECDAFATRDAGFQLIEGIKVYCP